MFSVNQKRIIANRVQMLLREIGHPELPEGEIQFLLHVDGAEAWSWADIRNNGAVDKPDVNPWNEAQARNLTEHQKAVEEAAGMGLDWSMANAAEVAKRARKTGA